MTNPDAVTEPSSSGRRERRHARKRQDIIDAAWQLARRDGLAGISLRDVADRVDLQQPSLYAYFGSKLDLYDAMFADGYQQLLTAVRDRPKETPPAAELAAYSELLVRLASADPERHQLLFQRTIPGFDPSPASYALATEFVELAAERLAALGVDSDEAIDLYTAVLAGLSHQQVANDPGGDRWVKVVRRAVRMYLAEVGATAPVGSDIR